jgi:malate dehydrogenase
LRRALERTRQRWPPGPVALAAAAVAVLRALASGAPTLLPLFVHLTGEYGHRGAALAVPAQLGARGLRAIVEVPLEPVERVALDNAAARQLAARL